MAHEEQNDPVAQSSMYQRRPPNLVASKDEFSFFLVFWRFWLDPVFFLCSWIPKTKNPDFTYYNTPQADVT